MTMTGANLDEAAAAYRKALELDPYLVAALINLANIHYSREELAEAQALYEQAIGLESDFFEAHFNLGNIYHDLGRFPEAQACYREALRLNPGTRTRTSIWPSRSRRWGCHRTRGRTGARISSSRRTGSGSSWRGSSPNRRRAHTRPSIGSRPDSASSACGAACRACSLDTRLQG